MLPSDRWKWSNETGKLNCSMQSYTLPSSKYQWIDKWKIDYNMKESDKEGWQYAFDFPK